MLSYGLGREKPKHSKDIARITFDVYKQSPRDLFGSLNIKATFYDSRSMTRHWALGPPSPGTQLFPAFPRGLHNTMRMTFQVPMPYCSLQHRTLLLSPITSTAGYCFCFGSIPSFFLELFLH